MHINFKDTEALAIGEHGEKAVLVAVEKYFFDYTALHNPCTATQTAQAQAGHPVHCAVKCVAAQFFQASAAARPPSSHRHISRCQGVDELGYFRTVDLVVAGESH